MEIIRIVLKGSQVPPLIPPALSLRPSLQRKRKLKNTSASSRSLLGSASTFLLSFLQMRTIGNEKWRP